MELGCSYNFCELFHVGRLNINYVKALVLDIEVPEVNTEIVTANKSLSITVYRNAVDMIGMSIGVSAPGYSGDNCIMVRKSWEL